MTHALSIALVSASLLAISSSAQLASESEPLAAAGVCSSRAQFSSLQKSAPSCWVDTPAAGATGTFDYPCDGGDAHLRFGKYDYRGVVTGGVMSFTLATEFDWSDGCHWRSEQNISGPVSGPLSFSYREYSVRGKGCLPPCSAGGSIALAPNGN